MLNTQEINSDTTKTRPGPAPRGMADVSITVRVPKILADFLELIPGSKSANVRGLILRGIQHTWIRENGAGTDFDAVLAPLIREIEYEKTLETRTQ